MIHFNCDYMAGAHLDVMKALADTNLRKSVGYGFDSYTQRAKEAILEACGLKTREVCFAVVRPISMSMSQEP